MIHRFLVPVLICCTNSLTGLHAQCNQWQPVSSNTTNLLRAVHFSDAQNGWVVGSGGTLLHSADGGITWSSQSGALGAGTTELHSVHFLDATTGWVVGAGGFVKKTINSGGAWLQQSVNTTTDLFDVFFLDANLGWITGACGLILRTTNGGSTWTQVSSGQDYHLYGVATASANNVAAVSSGAVLLQSFDNGATWPSDSNSSTGTDRNFRALAFSGDTGWAANSAGKVWKTTNSGATWSALTSPPAGAWQSVSTISSSNVYMAGLAGALSHSSDYGATWIDFSAGIASEDLYGFQMLNAFKGWAVGAGGKIFLYVGAAAAAPTCIASIPLHQQTNVPTTIAITWPVATDCVDGYHLDLGTAPGGTDLLNNQDLGRLTTYQPASLPAGKMIYVRITPYNIVGNAGGCAEFSFKTAGALACTRQSDSLELVKLYNTTNGPNWTNKWDLNKPASTWYGIMLNGQGCVTAIRLESNKLKGNLLDLNLPNLQNFSCANNQLSDSIPDFKNLSTLRYLYCHNNQLSGGIPDFKNLPILQDFSCDNNQLTGSIPDFINLSKLQNFWCDNNQLSGSIPDFKNLPNLQNFYCNNNQLKGGIPDFNNLHNLQNFWCDNNKFTFQDILPSKSQIETTLASNCTPGPVCGYDYTPQAPIFRDTTITRIAGQNLTVDLGIDAGLTTNLYQWYKNSSLWTPPQGNDSNSNKLIFNDLHTSDAGTYNVRVMNPGAPGLTLYGRNITLVVQCLPVANVQIIGPMVLCGAVTSLQGPTGYSHYLWSNNATTASISTNQSGIYTLTVTNAQGCTGTDTHAISGTSMPPAPQIVGPMALCPFEATLQAGNFASYLWSNNTTNASISTNQSGIYTVTVTNAQGCTGSDTHSVAGTVNLQANLEAPQGLELTCTLRTLTLQAEGGDTYEWSGPNGTLGGGANLTLGLPGRYTVRVTDTASGCSALRAETVLQSSTPPSASAWGDTLGCGQQAGMVRGVSDATNPTWQWTGPYNFSSTQQNPLVQEAGAYYLTVTAANGCTALAVAYVTHMKMSPMLLAQPMPNTACTGGNGTISLQVTGGTGSYTYRWSHGNTVQNPQNLPAGTYTVTVTDAKGCTATTTASVLHQAPRPHQDFRRTICHGDSLRVGDRFQHETGTYSYIKPGKNGGCDTVVSLQLEVQRVGVVLEASATFLCGGEALGLRLRTSNCPACAYRWSNSDWSGPGPWQFVPKGSATYGVTVASENGCSSTAAVSVQIWPNETIWVDSVICPDETILFCGLERDRTGFYYCKYQSQNGCDSLVGLRLTVLTPIQLLALPDSFDVKNGVASINAAVLGNDKIPPAVPWRVDILTPPAGGTASVLPDNHVLYRPSSGFIGFDFLTYQVSYDFCDGLASQARVDFIVLPDMPNVVSHKADTWNDHFDPLLFLQGSGLPLSAEAADMTLVNRSGSIVWRSGRPYLPISKTVLESLPEGQYYYVLRVSGWVFKGPMTLLK